MFPVVITAQVMQGAFNLGINATQVDGDEVYGYHKVGLHIGPSVSIPFNSFSFSLETIFNQKGAYQKATRPHELNKDSGQYFLKLNYVDIPVLLHYTDKDIVTVGAGVSWGRLVYIREKEHGKETRTNTLSNTYDKNDWNVLVDIKFKPIKKIDFLFVGVRYAYSMRKIRERTFLNGEVRQQYNNLLTFKTIWLL